MPQSKHAILLLGAGAATAWGAKLTGAITDLILQDEKFKTKGGQPLSQFLSERLREYYPNDPSSVNFETVIHGIELLGNYYRNKTAYGAGASFISSFPLWFKERDDIVSTIWNFEFVAGGYVEERGTVVNLSNGDSWGAVPPERAETIYLSKALEHYLSIISNEINRYCRDCRQAQCASVNENLIAFVNGLTEKGYAIRVYTTNYDRVFPILFNNNGAVAFFDGFDLGAATYQFHNNFLPNIPRILNDADCNCYYNLHGCINWVFTSDNFDIRYRFSCTPDTHHATFQNAVGANANPGEDIIVHNIVTGYNKLQRTSIEPLNVFQSRFMTDCINADIIITAGYSFSDFHLNRPLQYALEFNKPKLLNIAWCGDGVNYLHTVEGRRWKDQILGIRGDDFRGETEHRDNWIISDNKQQRVFNKGLSLFLTSQAWKEIINWI